MSCAHVSSSFLPSTRMRTPGLLICCNFRAYRMLRSTLMVCLCNAGRSETLRHSLTIKVLRTTSEFLELFYSRTASSNRSTPTATNHAHNVPRKRLLLPSTHIRQGLAQLVRSPRYSGALRQNAKLCSVVNGEKKKSGLIRKYGLNMSRQAFREKAADMGWVKVRSTGRCCGIGEADNG